jgi:hypothetical protein
MSDYVISAPSPSRPRDGLRVAAVVAGSTLALVAFLLLLAGAGLRWVDGHKDRDGFLTTSTERFHTQAYALATDDLDIDARGAGWLVDTDSYGKVRLRATSNDGKAVFVGIAPTDAVRRYLSDTAYSSVTDIDAAPFRASYVDHSGSARPGAPAGQGFWAASAQGAGPQTVTWDVRHGNWSVVVMNADGSRGVDAGVSAGADVPILSALGWSALGVGTLLAATAGGLLFLGIRRPRET